MKDLTSIIVPIYGVEKYLRQCVDSILNQTCRDLEIILVDDGGKDGCPAICDEYAPKDPRVVVIHKQNAGYGAAVNTGLDRASGEFVAIVEPDDWLETNAYESLMCKMSDGVDIVKGNYNSIRPDGVVSIGLEPKGAYEGVLDWHGRSEFLYLHPSVWTCLYRTSFLREKAIRMHEVPGAGWVDNPFQLETFALARSVVYVDVPIYNYRSSGPVDPLVMKGDWKTIYNRTQEMCCWLKEHRDIPRIAHAAIYRRCRHYAWTITKMAPTCGYWRISRLVRKYVRLWDESIIRDEALFDYYERRAYFYYRHLPLISVLRNNGLGPKGIIKRLLRQG